MAKSGTVSDHGGSSRVQRSFLHLQGWLLKQRFFTSTLLPAMPRQLRWALRRAYFAPVDLMERFWGDHDVMVPPFAERFTGYAGCDYITSGRGLAQVLVSYAGLQADSIVLDIGSGIGRLAVPLTRLITPPGSYDGLEIVERGVRWCSTKITPGYPNFRFTHADIFNAEYNPGGTVKAAEYVLPYDDASFDVVCLFSVFTHMLTADVERYVTEISRVLRPGGRVAATFIIINDETTKSMQGANCIYNFAYQEGPQWLFEEGMSCPELAVGYEEKYVRDLYASNGLDVTGLYLGQWSGQPATPATEPHGQDLVVGIRR